MSSTTGSNPPPSVAFTVEQCWNPSPGGTATAAVRLAEALMRRPDDVEIRLVAGRHPTMPPPPFTPPGPVAMLPLARPALYETWMRANWPRVEAVTGPVDMAHATGLIPCGTGMPMIVTLHDVAFLHAPEQFTKRGARAMQRALAQIRKRAHTVVVPSRATYDDCVAIGLDPGRLRLVPLGVDAHQAPPGDVRRVRTDYDLPDEFILFVGTLEPRKNLRRLVAAVRQARCGLPLVVAGAHGWGEDQLTTQGESDTSAAEVRWLGFVPEADLAALYAAATVFAYPSEREGFGLPVAEALAQGAAVVTSAGTSTEEVAGGAAVLVDPLSIDSIAEGIDAAHADRTALGERALRRAAELTWDAAADAMIEVYRHTAGRGTR